MTMSEKGLPKRWFKGSLWEVTGRAHVVTFIGAGGKTTCLQAITREIVSAGQQVTATTTTKVFPEEHMNVWKGDTPPKEQKGACFWYAKVEEKSGKWLGPPIRGVDAAIAEDLDKSKRYWVIEGDGARRLKLKCWEPHEPQIPQRSDCVVLVLEGSLWGQRLLAEQVHRPAGCLDLLGHVWNAERAWRYLLTSPVFAPQYEKMSWVIFLNCHEENPEAEDSMEPLVLLQDLIHRWTEIQPEVRDPENRPCHLRLAAGDAKEGKLQWFDLW